ncbi:MAG: lysophospholipid acyltransferase family protein [Candidatus Binatia bacterium]
MLDQPQGGSLSTAPQESLASFAARHPLRYLWGLGAGVWIVLCTLVLGLLAIALVLVMRRGSPIDVIGRWWGRCIVRACGIHLQVEGLEHLQPGQSYVLVSNHLSNFDIWCTLASMPITIRFVAKNELLRVPVLGQALALSDHIVIDRQNPDAAIARINEAAAHTPEGIGILFYGEGTRSRDGQVHEFKKGAVSLALLAQLPLVPMSVSGTRKFLPRGCAVIRPGGRVRIVLGEPIATAGLPFAVRDELNARVRDAVVRNFIPEFV